MGEDGHQTQDLVRCLTWPDLCQELKGQDGLEGETGQKDKAEADYGRHRQWAHVFDPSIQFLRQQKSGLDPRSDRNSLKWVIITSKLYWPNVR